MALHAIDEREGEGLQEMISQASISFQDYWKSNLSTDTYVNDALNRAKNRCDWRTDERNGAQEASLANENIEKCLMNSDEITERLGDGSSIGAGRNGGHALHLLKGGAGDGDDFSEALNDFLFYCMSVCNVSPSALCGNGEKVCCVLNIPGKGPCQRRAVLR